MTTIPGVTTIHERDVWEEPGFRMSVDFTRTPTAYIPRKVDLGVIHYSSASNLPDGDPGEKITDIIGWLRRSTRDYLENRTGGGYTRKADGRFFPGYFIGYAFAVDWLGGAWVIRGFDYLPAATNKHNDHTLPIIFITDGANPASAEAWATARAIWREARRRSGRADFQNRPLGHGEVFEVYGTGTPTACCGAGLYVQRDAGLGDLDHDEPTPAPPTTPEEYEMLLWRPKGFKNVFAIEAANAIQVTEKMMAAWGKTQADVIVEEHPQALESVLFKSGLDLGDLVRE